MNEPTIGICDAALAVQAQGLMTFDDMGNMSRAEIDELFRILVDYKRDGHFSAFWSSVPDSVRLMRNGRAVIESMFSPRASALRAEGVPVRYAAPRDGYRAWPGVVCPSPPATRTRRHAPSA